MFSVVIPLYNKPISIQDTLRSVISQTFDEFEVLIINDGSTDKSREKAAGISDPRIRIIDKENGGRSSARNLGIELAAFSHIAFLDADDIWEPEYLAEQKNLIQDFPEAGMWGCAYGNLKNQKKIAVDHGIQVGFRGVMRDYFHLKKRSILFWTSSVVVQKGVFDRIEPFDIRMTTGQDLDVWFRIILNFETVYYNKILAYHKLDAENRSVHNQPPLNERLPFFIDKYSEYRKSNPAFRKSFDLLCLRNMYPEFLRGNYLEEINYVLSNIDFSEHSRRWWLKYHMPRTYWLLNKVAGI
jgi:glycosyltransferase involved in cell wall biosynthesis